MSAALGHAKQQRFLMFAREYRTISTSFVEVGS